MKNTRTPQATSAGAFAFVQWVKSRISARTNTTGALSWAGKPSSRPGFQNLNGPAV